MDPSYQASADFLEKVYPSGPWHLVAIEVDKKRVVGGTMSSREAVLAWLSAVGGGYNVYWCVNPLQGEIKTKPSREDVKEMAWLHVDVDPRVGEPIDEERKRILAMLRAFKPTPTCIVSSGGGYQAFWRLKESLPINGQEQLYEDAKRYNLQLELLLGGDSCHNVDRIMRLPGTVNRPDKKKREKGRTEALAEVVDFGDVAYDISDFTPAPLLQDPEVSGLGQVPRVKLGSGNVTRTDDLSKLPVGDLCRVVIAQGHDPDDPKRWKSRSEPLFWICCELVRAGVSDDVIYGIITDSVWGISASVLDKGSSAHAYALRQIEQAREEAIDPWLRKLNDEYAVVMVGGKTRVLTETSEREEESQICRSRVDFMTFQDFEHYHRNKFVELLGANGKTNKVSVGGWWLSHPARREYRSVTFVPGTALDSEYNLWRGFAVEARPGDCSLYLQHVKENICGNRQDIYDYVIGWMAMAVQHPAQPGHTAIVLRGKEGTGKGVFANTFGSLWGRHYLTVKDSGHLFGNFNQHLADCVVLFCDEAFWAGNKKHEGALKSMITEREMVIEGKGLNATTGRNYLHLIMSSNEDWVVPAGPESRRFLVLDVSSAKMQDEGYFGAIERQMANGGRQALLHYLLTTNLSSFKVRSVPKTRALLEQKLHSMPPEQEWWHGKLFDGRLHEGEDGWSGKMFSTHLRWDFSSHVKNWGRHDSRTGANRLHMFLRSAVPWVRRIQASGDHKVVQLSGEPMVVSRPYQYEFPPLSECRTHWDQNFGGPYEWPAAEESPPSPVF